MRRTPLLIIAVLTLAACTSADPSAGESQAPLASSAASADASAPASVAPSAAASSLEPIPSDELGPFSCDLPVVEDPTVAIANVVDIRYATHPDYDRVVFEFEQGTPELTLDRATPPFTADGSGLPITVDGESFLQLTMRGGTKQMEDGSSSYDGPTEFTPGFPTLVSLVEAGDFEAQSTWIFGLSSEACVRVLTLTEDGAPRLVIDVEH